jgi:hypothetical protein
VTQILDCLVSYFGLDEDGRAGSRRYFCYHILAGPGPTAGAGVAVIATLAVHDEAERCTYCQNFHQVEAGGSHEALAVAVRYLDAHHEHDHLRKVQSDIRDIRSDRSTGGVPVPGTHFHQSQGVPTGEG